MQMVNLIQNYIVRKVLSFVYKQKPWHYSGRPPSDSSICRFYSQFLSKQAEDAKVYMQLAGKLLGTVTVTVDDEYPNWIHETCNGCVAVPLSLKGLLVSFV